MELFEHQPDPNDNLLPHDGTVNYYGKILSAQEATELFENLLQNAAWKNDEVMMFGKRIVTSRKIAWYADEEMDYTYSKIKKTATVWLPELLTLKNKVEVLTGEKFNSVLLNLYHNGSEGMGYHSDAEGDITKDSAIASLSLGAARKFVFKHKTTKERLEFILENGSLLVMKGATQRHWLHGLPPSKKILTPRINLTFRLRDPTQ
jgi:alkylated DNA repair dioxygenase AlkB